MHPRAVVQDQGDASLVVLVGSPQRTLGVLQNLASRKVVDIDWCRITGGSETSHLIGKVEVSQAAKFSLAEFDTPLAYTEVAADRSPEVSGIILEARIPWEPAALDVPMQAILRTLMPNRHRPFIIGIKKRPYVHETEGHYVRVQMMASFQELTEMTEALTEYWRDNGFHQDLLRWHIESEAIGA